MAAAADWAAIAAFSESAARQNLTFCTAGVGPSDERAVSKALATTP
jgi:hypothetical protein